MRRLLSVVLAGLLLAATASAATATTTKFASSGEEHVVSGPGTVLPVLNGTILSVRDEIHHSYLTGPGGTPFMGEQEGVANWDLDLVTGAGTLWGTSRLYITADGGLACSYTGVFPPGSWAAAWTGTSVCHGWGTLVGRLQSRSDLASATFAGEAFQGVVFTGVMWVPGDKE